MLKEPMQFKPECYVHSPKSLFFSEDMSYFEKFTNVTACINFSVSRGIISNSIP